MIENRLIKTERISYLTETFVNNPSKVFTLQYFSDLFDCAKSTISEDIDIIKSLLISQKLGEIRTIAGAAGGFVYIPIFTEEQIDEVTKELCDSLKEKSRIILGGYLYTNDIFYDSFKLKQIARCIVTKFIDKQFDYIVTIETKGIPLAITLGEQLNKPIVVVRKSARLTEGPTIQMNYIAGSSRSIKTMALPIRAIKRGSKVLFVDDFMKAGGTAKGVIDLMKEFEVEVVGIAVVMVTKVPEDKLIDDYYTLVELSNINENEGVIDILPGHKNS